MIVDIILIGISLFMCLLLVTVFVHMFFLIPYVPSNNRAVDNMIRVAKLKPNETVFDLGCGDARFLIEAEKKARVKAIGFEIAPLVYMLAITRKFISGSKAQINLRSFFNADLHSANVIFCYLFPNVMERLAEKIKKECKRGTRIISNTFSIPGLKLVEKILKDPKKGIPTIYVYKV